MDASGFIFAAATLSDDPTSAYVTRIVRLFPDGQLDQRFEANLSPVNSGLVAALPQANGDVIIAGGFTAVNDVPQQFLARIHGGPMGSLHLSNRGFDQGLPSFYAQIPASARYSLEAAESLPSTLWQTITNGFGDGTLKTLRDSAPSGEQRFYRLRSE
jgi:hypothetical protein